MSVKFYMDENVPGPITEGLRLRGVDVLTVQDELRAGRPDEAVMERAEELGRLVFTTDKDFLVITAERQARGLSHPGVFYSEQSGISYGACIRTLETVAACSDFQEWDSTLTRVPF